jgi:S-adenosylmethionine:tRNA ribosyltransferase-isomerase
MLARMRTSDFDYELPPERIAQQPLARRDEARLMVLRRSEAAIEHRAVRDLPDLLAPGDLLVLNDTRVVPCRVFGRKPDTGGRVEFLFLEETGPGTWRALLHASRRPAPGARIPLGSGAAAAEILEDGGDGSVLVRVTCDGAFAGFLEREGRTPLPPYIRRDGTAGDAGGPDRERYQTVYARRPGAVAAPTAGLHFTPELLERLGARGIGRTTITLHVGPGTFRPVKAERVEEHRMDAERFEVPAGAADAISRTRAAGGRVVAVGSTSVRALESAADGAGLVRPGAGRTDLFIRPPHRFRAVDAMLTNFHLPRSTLLMMVSALASRERVLAAYAEAVRAGYRFFSYGDAMLIL